MKQRWGKRKQKPIKIEHPLLTNLPRRSSEDVIQALLLRVRNGDEEACQQMVLEHMLLAKLKVQDFLSDYPRLQHELDDLVSVAVTAVVEAVNRIKTGSMKDHNNVTGYVRVAIWRYLGEWVASRTVASGLFRQLTTPTSANEEAYWLGDDSSVSLDDGGDWAAIEDDHSYMEVMDTLESLELLDEEWFIIESRLVGDTFEEIAENYNQVFGSEDDDYHPHFAESSRSDFGIRFVLQDILQRYLEKVKEDNV